MQGALALLLPAALLAFVSGCSGGGSASSGETGGSLPGDENTQPFAAIGEDEVLHFTGTEPFWGGETRGAVLHYKTPEQPEGARIEVQRFAGRGGLSLSGTLDGGRFDMAVTPGACSDGMSSRTYPFTVTLLIGEEQRQGCAWTDAHPPAGPERNAGERSEPPASPRT